MSNTLFIADLHLSADRPDITAAFMRFMRDKACSADALYVLGDLFEAWIGDDDHNPFTAEIKQAFKHLTDSGIPCYFIHGNRDFLIGKRFAKETGVQLLPEAQLIDLYGEPVLIMHGDSLCTRDLEYMAFRKKSRGWWWPRLMLALPLSKRRQIAENGRRKSQQNYQDKPQEIMDVTPSEVTRVMREYKVNTLIHGHTHRPDIHHFDLDGHPAKRVVLGDWYSQSSLLRVTPEGMNLEYGALDP
ncbi:UDP-2,3-diacylglucosamine diphosphatase [Aliiglaciecola sp. CAU 1673]|uniref:UDP-2,3-diacylglucosamine diphosphatase n=1 Tax=Aliiglaciecola sp. CAU 1673 TaxID=3032595 RepID=UPI0023DB85B9|nr:UDP-2,3-diacylglucosamine diphosphatase [Aliiglaciecola sp. CAU 1673]MDF2178074.1 UDP-2,3-diacylglucosamine diphosphatase [Aliiglaciecola sp. CAU 1673]